jgi:hypothetical protein
MQLSFFCGRRSQVLDLPLKGTILAWLLLMSSPTRTFAEGLVNSCTEADLRAALVGGGTVTFACDGTIVLTNTLVIETNTVLDGTGRTVAISGNLAVRVFSVLAGVEFGLRNLTVEQGGGLNDGAGVLNAGILDVYGCTFRSNRVSFFSGGGPGGAIRNSGILRVNNSSFLYNYGGGSGGAIAGTPNVASDVVHTAITNCTFGGNFANRAAALYDSNRGRTYVVNCTFTGPGFSTTIETLKLPGGQPNPAITLINTIVAHCSRPAVAGNFADGGGNILWNGGVNDVDPRLGPLADNGGPTLTMAPTAESPALNTAAPGVCPAVDQRGVTRPYGTACDIGAVEATVEPAPTFVEFSAAAQSVNESTPVLLVNVARQGGLAGTVTVNYATADGTATAGNDYSSSSGVLTFPSGHSNAIITIQIHEDALAEEDETIHVALSNPTGGASLGSIINSTATIYDNDRVRTITDCTEESLRFALGVGGPVMMGCDGTIILTSPIVVSNNASLDGAGHRVVISGGDATRILQVSAGVTFSLSRMTVANGRTSGGISGGGLSNEGNSRIFECTFSNNVAVGSPAFGGAIYHYAGQLRIDGCAFLNNQASLGGAVSGKFTFNQPLPEPASVFITNSTFVGNSAPSRGAALMSFSSAFVVANCTFAQNGSWAVLGGTSGPVRLVNTILAFNGTNNCSGVTDAGHNISTDASGNFSHPSSLQNTDPLLGPLTDNGGPTLCMEPLLGSPAIDTGDRVACPAVDQRGLARPYAYGCDIGAVESTHIPNNPGEFRFTSASYSQFEYESVLIVTVFRANGAAGAVSVDFATADGTAVAGVDYMSSSGTLSFASGEVSKNIRVPLLDDGVEEATETVQIALTNPAGGATLITPASATLSILDDDGTTLVTDCTENGLREALANPVRVQFACDGTIVLGSEIVISNYIVLDGNGHSVILSGGNTTRLFRVTTTGKFVLQDLTLANGLAVGTNGSPGDPGQPGGPGEGGAIYNDGGELNATNCTFAENKAYGGRGGQTASGSSFPGPGGAGRGGAIYNHAGQMTLAHCVLTGNQANGGNGGSGNIATLGGESTGGAIYSDGGTVTLVGCRLQANTSITGLGSRSFFASSGAAIDFSAGDLRIANCVLAGNESRTRIGSGAKGGALTQRGGSLEIVDSLLVANRTYGGFGSFRTTPGDAFGGGLYLQSGTALIGSSILASNRVEGGPSGGFPASSFGGGIFNAATLELRNCTFVANEARANWGAYGAGLYRSTGTAVLTHVTLANNAVYPASFFNGPRAGAIFSSTNGTLTLFNTIVANSLSGSNAFGPIVDGGHNLSSDASCNFTAPGSLNNTDPRLGPLADYGGPTPTMALLAGSPAIDAANSASCAPTDQRGRPRPAGAACDIGAFESSEPYTVLGRLIGYIPPPGSASVGSGGSTAQVDAFGKYALHGLAAGAHVLKPELALAVFVPKNAEVNVVADTVGIDFTSYRTNAIVISRTGPGSVRAIFAGEIGVTYEMQSSDGLPPDWSPYGTIITADSEGLIEWSDTNSTTGPGRFFRVRR